MEYILDSHYHKVSDNCLRFNFKQPIFFNNQKMSLLSFKYYNYFENVTNESNMAIKYKSKSILINFKNGSYDVSDINEIVNNNIQEQFNITESLVILTTDVNRYSILIIVEENWEVKLSSYFMELFGFTRSILSSGYHRSDLIPNVDKVKFLNLHCNLVDKYEYNKFLTDIDIQGHIGQQITYKNNHIYIRKNILNSEFNYIEICIKNQDNKPVKMTDLFKIRVYIS